MIKERLIVSADDPLAGLMQIHIVLNWHQELLERVPVPRVRPARSPRTNDRVVARSSRKFMNNTQPSQIAPHKPNVRFLAALREAAALTRSPFALRYSETGSRLGPMQ